MNKREIQKKHNVKIDIRTSYTRDNKGYYFNAKVFKDNETLRISASNLNTKSMRFNSREDFYNKLNEYLTMKEGK